MWSKIRIILIWIFCYILVACTAITLLAYAKYRKALVTMEELGYDLDGKIGRYELKVFPHPPLTGPAVPGNAETYYFIAENILEKPNNALRSKLWDCEFNPDKPIGPEVLAYLERNRMVIEFIQKGANAEYYRHSRFRKDIASDGIPFNVNSMVHFIILYARNLTETGRSDEALKLHIDLLRFGDDNITGWFGPIITSAINSQGLNALYSCLQKNEFSGEQINLLLNYLNWFILNEPDLQESWETELMITEFQIRKHSENAGFLPPAWLKYPGFKMAIFANKTDFADTWLFSLDVSNEIKRIDRLPIAQAELSVERANARLDRTWPKTVFYYWDHHALDYYTTSKQRYLEYITKLRGMYVFTAIKLYKDRHSKYPERIEDLVPEIIPEVPRDPFTDKFLIYKTVKDHDFILYGAGEDRTDNGGIDQIPARGPDVLVHPHMQWR